MHIDVLTLFPEMFPGVLEHSMLGRAKTNGYFDYDLINFRKYGKGKHQQVDDTPYGGGAGMLLKPEPIFEAIDDVRKQSPNTKKRIILSDPAGRPFDQSFAEELAEEDHLVFICGHYEGYDERIRSLVTDEVSIGDYVLTSGELASMVMIDAIIRLIPGVLGNKESAIEDSFSTGLLEHPHYTRPAEYRGMKVPDVLMSGNHKNINQWRKDQSLKRTAERRPDMLKSLDLFDEDRNYIESLDNKKD